MFEDCWKRMTILGAVLTALATPACAVDTDESEDVAELEMSLSNVVVPPQTIVPVTTNYTERDPNETYVPPSFSTPLPRDTRLDLPNNNSDFALFANPGSLTIQKMEGRDFWMMMNLYSVTVHKGDAGLLLIDTAGRLQNKTHLMEELEKVVRVIKKIDENAPHDVLLVLDATVGQNAHSQVEAFKKSVNVSGLVMTKLDGTAKGGVVVALADKFALPVHAIGVGEGADDLRPFSAKDFARNLMGLS